MIFSVLLRQQKPCLWRLVLLSAIALSTTFGSQSSASENPLKVVHLLSTSPTFMRVLRYRAPLNMVDADGAVGVNRKKYEHAAAQRDVLWLVLRGLAEKNPQAIDDSIRGLEYGFQKMTGKGNFANGRNVSAKKAVGADAFFLQSYCRIRLLVGASSYRNRFSSRFDMMDAYLTTALSWLKSNKRELYRQDKKATNRLFFDATAFALCGQIAADWEAVAIAKEFVEFGLANQRSDGSFNEHGGSDSSYQAVSLLNIAELLGHMKSSKNRRVMKSAMLKGAEWELKRITPSGEVLAIGNTRTGVGKEGNKEINYYEVVLMFFYLGHFLGDQKYVEVGTDISNYMILKLR